MSADDSSEGGIPKYFKSIAWQRLERLTMSLTRGALPAKDSWIALDPGTEFELNAKTQEEWLAKVRRFRRVRGNFLAASFDLEYTIDSIINEVFFPKPRSECAENLKRLFDEIFLKSPTRSFGRKITS